MLIPKLILISNKSKPLILYCPFYFYLHHIFKRAGAILRRRNTSAHAPGFPPLGFSPHSAVRILQGVAAAAMEGEEAFSQFNMGV